MQLTYQRILAMVVAGAVLAAVAWQLIPAASIEPSLHRYPDTGAGLPRPSRRRSLSEHVHGAIRLVGFEDQVWPEEDLLQKRDPLQMPPQELVSPPQRSDDPQEVRELVTPRTLPQVNTPPASTPPAQPRPAKTIPSPSAQPTPPPSVDPAQPSTNAAPPNWPAFDKNAPPGADEDLLQGDNRPNVIAPKQREQGTPGSIRPPTAPGMTPSDAGSPPAEVLPGPWRQPVPPTSPPVGPSLPTPPPVVNQQPPATLPPVGQRMPSPHAPHAPPPSREGVPAGEDPHAAVFAESLYPSAKKCRPCHEHIYDEWAVSSHAYAAVSPMFNKFEQTISTLTKGTIGYFCMRCHAPVAVAMGQDRWASILHAPEVFREGVTCVACHRVREQYGKANGERRMEPGDRFQPYYGAGYGEGLAEVLSKKDHYKVKGPGEKGPGQEIHQGVIHFEQLASSHFCVSCHQVAVYPGIKLEVVWEQYRASPACKQGIQCQECHMGKEPGLARGYDTGPVAVVNGKPISPHRKHSNHEFFGPGYSIAHPGIFPFNVDAEDWAPDEWLQYDYRAGWGTDEFEDALADGEINAVFPKVWENSDDRYDARDVIEANLKTLLAEKKQRSRLMENATEVEGPFFARPPRAGHPLKFNYLVTNKSTGHNTPSGSLGAQPQLWLNVALTGPDGRHLWESGYVDGNGDIADLHSLEVAAGRIHRDQQLFNLQTKFLISHVKGTDREMYLPINTDIDQLPFIRPSAFPITVMNHPPFIRMESHSLPPLGRRAAKYTVPAHLMQTPGRYRLSARMRSRGEPIYFMRFCNATPQMERSMNEWMLDYHEYSVDFYVQ